MVVDLAEVGRLLAVLSRAGTPSIPGAVSRPFGRQEHTQALTRIKFRKETMLELSLTSASLAPKLFMEANFGILLQSSLSVCEAAGAPMRSISWQRQLATRGKAWKKSRSVADLAVRSHFSMSRNDKRALTVVTRQSTADCSCCSSKIETIICRSI